jgi:DNA-binding transcriptional MerR regulator
VGSYTKRDAERLLKVKNHILRYWEKEISLIQPAKDNQGRLHYSDRDLQIMLRLKYLIQERHFTMEGARDQLYRELTERDPGREDIRAHAAALRSELLELLALVVKNERP